MNNTLFKVIAFFFISTFLFSQEIKPELINENLKELNFDYLSDPLSNPKKEFLDNLIDNNNIYYFDLVYNNQIIYTQTIHKHGGGREGHGRARAEFNIYLDSDVFSGDDILDLLDNRKNKRITVQGSKYIKLSDFYIAQKDGVNWVPAKPLSNLEVNIYKIKVN